MCATSNTSDSPDPDERENQTPSEDVTANTGEQPQLSPDGSCQSIGPISTSATISLDAGSICTMTSCSISGTQTPSFDAARPYGRPPTSTVAETGCTTFGVGTIVGDTGVACGAPVRSAVPRRVITSNPPTRTKISAAAASFRVSRGHDCGCRFVQRSVCGSSSGRWLNPARRRSSVSSSSASLDSSPLRWASRSGRGPCRWARTRSTSSRQVKAVRNAIPRGGVERAPDAVARLLIADRRQTSFTCGSELDSSNRDCCSPRMTRRRERASTTGTGLSPPARRAVQQSPRPADRGNSASRSPHAARR